jgi:hypothetical protein
MPHVKIDVTSAAITRTVLQRNCACGNHMMAGGECAECSKKNRLGLQTKLKVNEPDGIYEQEADRIAYVVGANQPSVLRPILELIFGADLAPFTRGPAQVDQILSIPSPRIENALLQDCCKTLIGLTGCNRVRPAWWRG